MLTVYQMPHSPYCIPVTRALGALSVPFEVVNIAPHTREEVIVASGGRYYQVPMLDHDGDLLFESSGVSIDIARYIDSTFAGGRLFPEPIEGVHLPMVDFIEGELEGVGFKLVDPTYIQSFDDVLMRTLIVRHKERRFGLGCVEQWRAERESLMGRFVELLAPAERSLGRRPFLFGESPVYADFALFGVLGNVTYNGWNTLPGSLGNIGRGRDAVASFTFSV